MQHPAELLHQLQQTNRIFTKGLNRKLKLYGISASEWVIIWNLSCYGAMTQAKLADFLNIEPPAISNSLSRLERKDLINKKIGDDKRERTVFLSEKAISQFPKWERVCDTYRNAVLCNVTKQDQNELYRLLNSIYNMVKLQDNEL